MYGLGSAVSSVSKNNELVIGAEQEHSVCTDKLCRLLLVNTNRAPKRGVAIYRSKSLNAAECEELKGSVSQESVWCNFTSTNEENVLIGRIYKSPNSTEKNIQELLKLMKSDLWNNYDKIYIVGDFNYPSVRWDGEWSNNKDEFVECARDVFLTQTVKKFFFVLFCFLKEERRTYL